MKSDEEFYEGLKKEFETMQESLSGIASGQAAAPTAGTAPTANHPERKLTREEELFERFQLMRVPEKFCQYTVWFRGYLIQHPDALKTLEPMLCD